MDNSTDIDTQDTNTNTMPTRKELRDARRQERLSHRQAPGNKTIKKVILLWGGFMVVIALVVLGMIKLAQNEGVQKASSLTVPVSAADWQTGPKDSKATLVEYSDFQCPACGAYHPIIKQLIKELGDKMLFVYRYFPLRQIHKNAEISARAGEAAGKQGKFWEMHDMLFENQNKWADLSDSAVRDVFTQYATALKLNLDQFKKDLDSNATLDKINADYSGGTQSGVDSTPTFFLNGEKILNAPQTVEDFKKLIETRLNAK